MKLSKKQAELLAVEVLKAIKRQGYCQVPETTIQKLNQWKKERDKLITIENEAEQKRRAHDVSLSKITGKIPGIYANNPLSDIIEKIKAAGIPSLSEIEDKITLKAMFTNDEDLQTFVQTIVREFSKKKKDSVSAN